ncbi:MAG: hypothetical protein ABSE46_19015 [Terracidiphilus sp.]|jgi:malate dehydrogenase (oxaloacetate-decarboxylating)
MNDEGWGSLPPPLSDARSLGRLIGEAVGRQAILDGEAQVISADELMHGIEANIWETVYEPHVRAS